MNNNNFGKNNFRNFEHNAQMENNATVVTPVKSGVSSFIGAHKKSISAVAAVIAAAGVSYLGYRMFFKKKKNKEEDVKEDDSKE